MRWQITGAKADSGVERTWNIEAPSAEAAESAARKHGILVSNVQPASQRERAAVALAEMTSSGPPAMPAVPSGVAVPPPKPGYVQSPAGASGVSRVPLVPCAACGHEISLAALACPRCGHPQHPAEPVAATATPQPLPMNYATPYANAAPRQRVQVVELSATFTNSAAKSSPRFFKASEILKV